MILSQSAPVKGNGTERPLQSASLVFLFSPGGHDRQYLAVPLHNRVVAAAVVRIEAAAAIFVAVFEICEAASAALAQHVQRAVAEKAVEVVGVGPLVTWEKFALAVGKIRIALSLGHIDFPRFCKKKRRVRKRHATQWI